MITFMAHSLHYLPSSALKIARRGGSAPRAQGTQPIMRSLRRPLVLFAEAVLLSATALLFAGPAVQAAPVSLSGTYRCVSVEIAGKAKHCTAPSIEMNSDGSYQILSEHGTYEILRGHWLVLSASKNHGRARLDGNNKQIIFEFFSGGKKSKITYRRKYQRPPAWVSS